MLFPSSKNKPEHTVPTKRLNPLKIQTCRKCGHAGFTKFDKKYIGYQISAAVFFMPLIFITPWELMSTNARRGLGITSKFILIALYLGVVYDLATRASGQRCRNCNGIWW
jgi:hypothetical protein